MECSIVFVLRYNFSYSLTKRLKNSFGLLKNTSSSFLNRDFNSVDITAKPMQSDLGGRGTSISTYTEYIVFSLKPEPGIKIDKKKSQAGYEYIVQEQQAIVPFCFLI